MVARLLIALRRVARCDPRSGRQVHGLLRFHPGLLKQLCRIAAHSIAIMARADQESLGG